MATEFASSNANGLVTKGSSFLFLKLVRQETPRYARSREFILDKDGGSAKTLQILKALAALVSQR